MTESNAFQTYRRKPQAVTAVKWDGTPDQFLAITHMTRDDFEGWKEDDGCVVIEQDDGEVWCYKGDWIVSEPGPYGRLYSFSDKEFEAKYESV